MKIFTWLSVFFRNKCKVHKLHIYIYKHLSLFLKTMQSWRITFSPSIFSGSPCNKLWLSVWFVFHFVKTETFNREGMKFLSGWIPCSFDYVVSFFCLCFGRAYEKTPQTLYEIRTEATKKRTRSYCFVNVMFKWSLWKHLYDIMTCDVNINYITSNNRYVVEC